MHPMGLPWIKTGYQQQQNQQKPSNSWKLDNSQLYEKQIEIEMKKEIKSF